LLKLDYIGAAILPIAAVLWLIAAFTLQRKGKVPMGIQRDSNVY